ncbi:MAG TPA: lipase family protein [Fibrobacteria bacterium]|nr:lipase family protein [Fibrobacteria bacterium]
MHASRRLSASAFAALLLAACAPAKKFCPQDYAVDFSEALRYATLADQAYAPDTVVARECGWDSCFFFRGPASDARAFVRVDDSARIQWIAFRGTSSIAEIKLDADYTQTEDSVLHMRLHRGFAAAARDLYPLIRPHLSSSYRTRMTGHSLGGAIAVVSGLYLRQEGFDVEVETFGQPKVTNAAGALRADSLKLVRFLNGRDLVTQVPPLSFSPGKLGSYEHFGKEVALLDGNGYECLSEPYRAL